MDFEEFVWAIGNESIMDFIKDYFNNRKNLGELLYCKAMDYFKEYLIVGGMPQAVEAYLKIRNFDGVFYWLNDTKLVNIVHNTIESNIGLGHRLDDNSLKVYMFDTVLSLSMTFNEKILY